MPTEKDLAGLKIELEKTLGRPVSDDTVKWLHHHIFWRKTSYEDVSEYMAEVEHCEALMIDVTKEMAEVMAYFIHLRWQYALSNGTEFHAWHVQRRANVDQKFDASLKKEGRFK